MAKTISVYDTYYFLKQCSGVMLEGRWIEPRLYEIEDEESNIFAELEWEEYDEETKEMVTVLVSFFEGDNENVTLNGSKITLMNDAGQEEELTLLQEWYPLTK